MAARKRRGAGLTEKQRRFVQEYLVDLNATAAAKRAGYSERTAYSIGEENLRKPDVAAAIAQAQAEREERTKITQDRVLQELALIGFADMGDYVQINPDGSAIFDWSDLPAGATKVVQEITQETVLERDGYDEDGKPQFTNVRKTKFKLYDKRATLVDIGKHLGMFKDRVVVETDPLSGLYGRVADQTEPIIPENGKGNGSSVH